MSARQQKSPNPTRQRLQVLQSEIQELRRTSPPPASKTYMGPPGPPVENSRRALFLLVEAAHLHVALLDLAAARRAIADAVILLEQMTDEPTIARASILIGEALLGVDSPQHAKPRFTRGLAILERISAGRWELRAKIGLGRTLVALDDPMGCEVLVLAKELAVTLGDTAAITLIQQGLADAQKLFDTPRSVHTGYGRPVSIPPPSEQQPD